MCTVDSSAFKDTYKGPCQGTMHGTLMGLSSVHYVLQNQKDANYTSSLISSNTCNSATD